MLLRIAYVTHHKHRRRLVEWASSFGKRLIWACTRCRRWHHRSRKRDCRQMGKNPRIDNGSLHWELRRIRHQRHKDPRHSVLKKMRNKMRWHRHNDNSLTGSFLSEGGCFLRYSPNRKSYIDLNTTRVPYVWTFGNGPPPLECSLVPRNEHLLMVNGLTNFKGKFIFSYVWDKQLQRSD